MFRSRKYLRDIWAQGFAFGSTGVGVVDVGATDAEVSVTDGLMPVEVLGSCGNASGLQATS